MTHVTHADSMPTEVGLEVLTLGPVFANTY